MMLGRALKNVIFASFALCSSAHAIDWSADNHTLLSGDYDSDGITDVRIEPTTVTTSVEIPYDITLNVDAEPLFDNTILINSSTDFSLTYSPDQQSIDNVTWVADTSVEHFGDFNGDGYQDLVIQGQGANSNLAVILGFPDGGAPSLWKTLSSIDSGIDLSATGSSISIQDANNDGFDDIRVINLSDSSEQIFYADSQDKFTELLSYPGCDANGLADTDCDGTADRYDGDIYNTSVTSSLTEATITDAPVGKVEGDFNVTRLGKASYTVPLKLVPGNASPALSLNYDQQAGNGVLGVGWYIDGLSEISRCPTTLVQDGYINGVNFNSSDQFCINGQRLVEISTNQYRTENESFAKIVSNGSAGNGPASFTVWKKDGTIEVYGGTANSRRLSQSGGHVMTWAISQREDRETNYATYAYHNDTANGEFWVTEVAYNGNQQEAKTPNKKLTFIYESRADITPSLTDSILSKISQRIATIQTYQDVDLVREYKLTYVTGSSGRSLISSVEECLSNQVCLPATTFTWDTGLQNESNLALNESATDSSFPVASFQNQQYLSGDVNGDGKNDVIWTYRDNNTLGRLVVLAKSDGSGFTKQTLQTENGYFASVVADDEQRYISGDINGDGKTDLVWLARHGDSLFRTVYLANQNGTGFTSQGYEVDSDAEYSDFLDGRFQLADVNGDKLQDVVWVYQFNNKLGINVYLSQLSGGAITLGKVSKLVDTDLSPDFYTNFAFLTGDVNGDGKDDLVWSFAFQNSVYRVLFLANPNGSSFTKISLQEDALPTTSTDHNFHLSDLNSDGKADLVWTYNTNNQLSRVVYQASRLGTSFNKKTTATDTALSLQNHTHGKTQFTDLNGDDRSDLIYTYVDNTTFGWVSYLADLDGDSFTKHQSGTGSVDSGTDNHEYQFADVTGDGKSDLIWTYNTSTGNLKRNTYTQLQSYPDHVTQISNGFGEIVKIYYDYLADSSIYTKGANVSYPLRNDNGLSYVVSSVERSNGLGGFNSWSYSYKGARTHLTGRGFLGFKERTVTENLRNLKTTEIYHQNFPFTGELASQTVERGATLLEETYRDLQQVSLNSGKNLHRYLAKQATVKYNLTDGGEEYASVLENSFDHTTGNITQTITKTGLGYSSYNITTPQQTITTDYSYDNNTVDWRLGFLTSETKTFSVPGETNRVVTTQFVPVSSTSFLRQNETLFAGTSVEQVRSYLYDNFGNIVSTSVTANDIDSTVAATQVDTVNNYVDGQYPDISTNAENHQEQREFDERYGTETLYIDANGLYVDNIVDGFGHTLFTRRTDGTEIINNYSWCNSNCPVDAGNALYSVTTTVTHPQVSNIEGEPEEISYFDMFDRLVAKRIQHDDGTYVWTQTDYDALGRVAQQSQPYLIGNTAYWTVFSYDVLDRVTNELRPDGGITATQYLSDATHGRHGIVTTTIKVPGSSDRTQVSHLYSNSLGQLLLSVDPNNTETDFLYDAQGHLRWTQVDNNPATAIVIDTDVSGNKIALNDPDAGEISYEYDGFGRERRLSYGASAQQTIVSTYDRLGRLLTRTDNDGVTTTTATWSYDPTNGIGELAQESGSNVLKTYTYDSLSRVSQIDEALYGEAQPKSFVYTYDDFSRAKGISYPSGVAITYQYDAHGYVDGIKDAVSGDDYWQILERDAFGNVVKELFANGVETERLFDPAMGRIGSINTGQSAALNSHQSLQYLHDSSGNLTQRSSSRAGGESLNESFSYDALNRVTGSSTTGLLSGTRGVTYDYDALGNILTKSDVSDVNGYSYGANGAGVHAVTSVVNQGVTTSYQYDFKGNMITRGSQSLSYSVFNKPLSITDTIESSQIAYGPDRSRIYQYAEKDGEVIETYYYGPSYQVAQRGQMIREKTTIDDFLVVTKIKNVGSPSVSEDIDYLHKDHLGSVEAISDRFGNFTGRYSFDVWGKRQQDNWEKTDSVYDAAIMQRAFESTTRSFTGHEYLDSVELIHMNGRVYDPIIGRFLSPDDYVQMPESSQSYNRYTYVLNNPLSYTDPSGELVFLWGVAVLAVKAYDIYTTVEDVHATVTDDNLSTAEKSGELFGHLATAVVPGKGIAKKVIKSKGKPKETTKVAPQTDNVSVGSKQSQKGTGSDKSTTPKKDNRVESNNEASFSDSSNKGDSKDELGFVYKRIDPKTGEEYIGQAKSPKRFDARKAEHDRAKGVKHIYEVQGRAKQGTDLDVLEETKIREFGGIEKRNGNLANKRHQMSEKRYRDAGGKADLPYEK